MTNYLYCDVNIIITCRNYYIVNARFLHYSILNFLINNKIMGKNSYIF